MRRSLSQSTATIGESLNIGKESQARMALIHQSDNRFNIREEIRLHSPGMRSKSQPQLVHEQPSLSSTFQVSTMESSTIDSAKEIPRFPSLPSKPKDYEDSTVNSAQNSSRTQETEITESNSLFKARDDHSIDMYMQKILEDGKISPPPSPPNLHPHSLGSLEEHPSVQDLAAGSSSLTQSSPSRLAALSTGKLPFEIVEDAEAAVHYDIRCNNLSSWRISTASVKIHMVNFQIIESIIYRESLLLRLQAHVEQIDQKYWMYAVDRIKMVEAGKLLHCEYLVAKRNQIFLMQNKLSVEIAHFRALNISILENVRKIRTLINLEVDTHTSVSIYWKGQNYLLKMMNDLTSSLRKYFVTRYWFGFYPNPLMLPPEDRLHQPLQQWKLQTGTLFNAWLAMHKEKVVKEKKGTTKHRRGYIIQDTKFLFDNLQLLQEVEKEDHAQHRRSGGRPGSRLGSRPGSRPGSRSGSRPGSRSGSRPGSESGSRVRGRARSPEEAGRSRGREEEAGTPPRVSSPQPPSPPGSSDPTASPGGPAAPSPDRPGAEDMHYTGRGLVPSRGPAPPAFEPWEQLRDYCDYSWGAVEPVGPADMARHQVFHPCLPDYLPPSLLVQSPDTAPFFWNNAHHNPYVVEAAVGLADVFPPRRLVPALPRDLRAKCLDLHAALQREVDDHRRLEAARDRIAARRRDYEQVCARAEAGGEGGPSRSRLSRDLLKRRQQADSSLLAGVSAQYVAAACGEAPRGEGPGEGPGEGRGVDPSACASTASLAGLMAGEAVFSLTADDHDDDDHDDDGGEGRGLERQAVLSGATRGLSLLRDVSAYYPPFTLEAATPGPTAAGIQHRVRDERSVVSGWGEDRARRTARPQPSRRTDSVDTQDTQGTQGTQDTPLSHPAASSRTSFDRLSQPSRSLSLSLSSSFLALPPLLCRASFHWQDGQLAQAAVRSDRRGRREIFRLDPRWHHTHATHIQRIMRGYLARKYVRRLRRKQAWKRTAVKLQGAVRGFVTRMKQKRVSHEQRVETFLVRKNALKRFRAAITISRFIRKCVNQYRLRKSEPLLVDKLDDSGQRLTKKEGVRRLRSSLLSSDLSEMLQGTSRRGLLTADDDGLISPPPETPPVGSPGGRKSLARDLRAAAASPSLGLVAFMSRQDSLAEDSTLAHSQATPSVGMREEVSGLVSPASRDTARRHRGDFESDFSVSSMDEAERLRLLKQHAVSLVKRVNAGRVLPDSRRESRLIPIEAASPLKKLHRRPKLSVKERVFLQDREVPPQSMASSTAEVYAPPRSFFGKHRPKGAVVYKSAEELKQERDMREASKLRNSLKVVFGE